MDLGTISGAVVNLFSGALICFCCKIAKLIILPEKDWNKKVDRRSLIGFLIATLVLAGAWVFLHYYSETSIEIQVKREIAVENNEKKYKDCHETTSIYLDGESKGKAPQPIKTTVGEHSLHLRYEDNVFYKDYGPEAVYIEKGKPKLSRKLDKNLGILEVHVRPKVAEGNASITIIGDGFRIENSKNLYFYNIPFGHYQIIGSWEGQRDSTHTPVISKDRNTAFLSFVEETRNR